MTKPFPALNRLALTRAPVLLILAGAGLLVAALCLGRWLRVASAVRPNADANLATATNAITPRLDRGEIVFQVHCSKCHGPDGHGDAEAMERLRPPPRDFATRPWRFEASLESIYKVTAEGIPATAMPAHRAALSSADLNAVVAHTYRLATTGPITIQSRSPLEEALVRSGFAPEAKPRQAPQLSLFDCEGRRRTLGDEFGRIVVLHFWGTTCEHCLAAMPKLQAFAAEWQPRGLTVLNVCADAESGEAQQLLREISPQTRVWVDETGLANSQFEVQVLPTIWLIDRQGKLLGRAQGMQDWTSPALQALVKSLLTPDAKSP